MTPEPQNIVCPCNQSWGGVLKPPPCPYHGVTVHNGLCECRGHLDRHPFHADAPQWSTAGVVVWDPKDIVTTTLT